MIGGCINPQILCERLWVGSYSGFVTEWRNGRLGGSVAKKDNNKKELDLSRKIRKDFYGRVVEFELKKGFKPLSE